MGDQVCIDDVSPEFGENLGCMGFPSGDIPGKPDMQHIQDDSIWPGSG